MVIALLAWRWPVSPVSEKQSLEPQTNFITINLPQRNPDNPAEQAQVRHEGSDRPATVSNGISSKQIEHLSVASQPQSHEIAEASPEIRSHRYLMPVEEKPDITLPRLAVAAASQDKFDTALADSVSLMAGRSGFYPVDGLVKSEFVSDGLFAKAFDGEFDSFNTLGFSNRCDFLALCQLTTTVSSRPAFQANVADGKLQIRLFRVSTWELVFSKEYETNAAAFKVKNAIAQVHDRLIDILKTRSFPKQLTRK